MNEFYFILIIGFCIIIFYFLFSENKNRIKETKNNGINKTIVHNIEKEFISQIRSIITTNNNKYLITYDNGIKYPHEKDLFFLLNPVDVMIGKNAIYIYGIQKNRIKTSKKILKELEKIKSELYFTKARQNEEKIRLIQDIKDLNKNTESTNEKN